MGRLSSAGGAYERDRVLRTLAGDGSRIVLKSPTALRALRYAPVALAFATGLMMVAFGFRAQSLVNHNHDPYLFEAMARNLLAGHGFDGYGVLLHRRGPLYPAFIAAVYLVTGPNAAVIYLIQAVLFALTAGLAQSIGRRLVSERAGWIAGIACAVHPVLLRYVADLQLECLFAFLVTLAIWLSVRLYERPSPGHALGFGVLCGIAALTKPVILGYPPLFVALWWWSVRRRDPAAARRLIPPALAALAALALTIAPWTVRNFVATGGHFVPVTTGLSDAVLRGLIFTETDYLLLRKPPYTYAENASNAYFETVLAREGQKWQADDVVTDRVLNQEMIRRIKAEPLLFARKCAVSLLTFWYQMTSRLNSLIAGAPAIVAWCLAVLGWRRARRDGSPLWLALLPVFYLNVALALLLALGRYSVPVLPALMVAAGAGADALLERRRL